MRIHDYARPAFAHPVSSLPPPLADASLLAHLPCARTHVCPRPPAVSSLSCCLLARPPLSCVSLLARPSCFARSSLSRSSVCSPAHPCARPFIRVLARPSVSSTARPCPRFLARLSMSSPPVYVLAHPSVSPPVRILARSPFVFRSLVRVSLIRVLARASVSSPARPCPLSQGRCLLAGTLCPFTRSVGRWARSKGGRTGQVGVRAVPLFDCMAVSAVSPAPSSLCHAVGRASLLVGRSGEAVGRACVRVVSSYPAIGCAAVVVQ